MKRTLEIPSNKKYIPYPIKKDGFITKVLVEVDGHKFTKTYTGKLTRDELPLFIHNEYSDCKVLVNTLAYYQFIEADSIELIFNAK